MRIPNYFYLKRADRIPGLRIDDVVDALDLQDGIVVADFGAGAEAFSVPFAQSVGPTGRVLVVEIWPEPLEFITTRVEKAGIENVDTILCSPNDPKLPPKRALTLLFLRCFS
jgi:tRNA A58 N-methylase Trm61